MGGRFPSVNDYERLTLEEVNTEIDRLKVFGAAYPHRRASRKKDIEERLHALTKVKSRLLEAD
jgi:hypothetical protein